ncbi:MAG: excinuclease ABC subunit A [Rickettsiales bacterium]|nr:MAG: excinuclease ABC subunit A [Rickettsiales bacterium]
MIKSFKCKHTKNLFEDIRGKKFSSIAKFAKMRLTSLSIACSLNDLKSPPSNRLEALKGDRKNQYSIRINKQYRLCFSWQRGDAYDVEVVDYH